MNHKKSLNILTPMYGGQLALNYHSSFVKLVLLCRDRGIDVSWSNVWNESLISRARNRLADNFLKNSNDTHAVFIDADIGFNAEDVLRMLDFDVDILGVPCSKKSLRWDKIQAAIRRTCDPSANGHYGHDFTGAELREIGGDFVMNFKDPLEIGREIKFDKLEEMSKMGTGLLMIKREVFEKFKKSYPDRWYEAKGDPTANPGPIHDFFKVGVNPETREYDSEDYWFCRDAIAIGFKVWMLGDVVTSHIGSFEFVGNLPGSMIMSGGLV